MRRGRALARANAAARHLGGIPFADLRINAGYSCDIAGEH